MICIRITRPRMLDPGQFKLFLNDFFLITSRHQSVMMNVVN